MSKYIIEIPDDVPYVLLRREEYGKFITKVVPVSELEELNSDYINEHYGQMQDEAYRKGLEDGKTDNGYQDGVGDAWQTINLIRKMSQHTRETRFGANELGDIMGKYTAKELIAMMRPYFVEPVTHSDRIEVGDEVDWDGDCFVVTRIYQPLVDKRCNGIAKDGSVYMDVVCDRLTKTGRHFDIASILEAMRTHD